MIVVAVVTMLTFHGPTGARIDINGEAITSIRDPHAMPGHWSKNVHCIVIADGAGAIAVMETCNEVRDAIRGKTGPCVLVCGGKT